MIIPLTEIFREKEQKKSTLGDFPVAEFDATRCSRETITGRVLAKMKALRRCSRAEGPRDVKEGRVLKGRLVTDVVCAVKHPCMTSGQVSSNFVRLRTVGTVPERDRRSGP